MRRPFLVGHQVFHFPANGHCPPNQVVVYLRQVHIARSLSEKAELPSVSVTGVFSKTVLD